MTCFHSFVLIRDNLTNEYILKNSFAQEKDLNNLSIFCMKIEEYSINVNQAGGNLLMELISCKSSLKSKKGSNFEYKTSVLTIF